jgi:hypothetical protein
MTDAREIDNLARALQIEAAKFNEAAPTVNNLLQLADEKLEAANPGVEFWLPQFFDQTEDEKLWAGNELQGDEHVIGFFFHAYQVGYARIGEGWGLASRVVEVEKRDSGPQQVIVQPWRRLADGGPIPIPLAGSAKAVPLRNAPMTVRIEALGSLPEIFKGLTELLGKRNLAVANATKQLKQ